MAMYLIFNFNPKIASWGSFEYAFPRKTPGCMFASALTCWIGVPFEVARMAYYADKTFPKELQRGYKSYFNALFRIPFEEGSNIYCYSRPLLFVQELFPPLLQKLPRDPHTPPLLRFSQR